MKKYDYTKNDIKNALIDVDIRKGDSVFIHSNLGFFGKLKECQTMEDYCKNMKDAFFEIIGSEGTLTVPTFSYSFCNNEDFDVNKTKGVCGIFSEYIRSLPESIRSEDPNFSIASIGKNAKLYTKNPPEHSFGKNSFWERFLNNNGKICNLNFDAGSTFVHYVEKCLNVPYRYDKSFKGKLFQNGIKVEKTSYHFVYDLKKTENGPNFSKLHKKAVELNKIKKIDLGRGQIVCILAREVFELIKKEIEKNPEFLINGKQKE